MLTVIASPIGSVEELSLQAGKAIASADIILCEDTRTFIPFLKSIISLYKLELNKNQKVHKYYKDIEFVQLHAYIKQLEQGKNIALVSEAGTPLVSDPGRLLIDTCQKRRIAYTSIPGSSAPMNAGVLAGCRFDNFLFVGFLPKKKSAVEKQLLFYNSMSKSLKHLEVCFFESPKRIHESLGIISTVLPDAVVCICREMNKNFEEVVIGKASELTAINNRGEFTIVLKF